MKKVIKLMSLLLALSMLIVAASCGDDDDPPIGGDDEGSFKVADGLYIAGVSGEDITAVAGQKLGATKVEAASFGTQDRDGYFSVFTYLASGSYLFIDVADQESEKTYGGELTTFNDDSGENGDSYTGAYSVISGLSTANATTDAFKVSTAGYYHVVFDTQEDEALLIKIGSWGVIGGAVFSDACKTDGFNSDVDLKETSANAEGATYAGTGIILKGTDFKIRYNDSWKIDRRMGTLPADDTAYEAKHGYVALANFGGTIGALEEGASNIGLSDNNLADATYDISVTFDANGAPSIVLTSVEDAPVCAFDPDNYAWGIIGGATFKDWEDDKDLTYINGEGGVHKWRGVFPMADGGGGDAEFKFRTDDSWAVKLTSGSEGESVTVVDNTLTGTLSDNGASNGDGAWFVEALPGDFLYVEISTEDSGKTWTLTFDEASWEVIGAASGGWEEDDGVALATDDNLVSASNVDVTLTADEYKFRLNEVLWDFNVGGDLDALVYNGENIKGTTTGAHTVIIKTADGGVSYTATVTKN